MNLYLLLFASTTLFLLYFIWKVSRNRNPDANSLSKLNLKGPHNHNLGVLCNILKLRNKKKTTQVLLQWCMEYGPLFVVRFVPCPMIFLNSPEYVQKLLSSSESAHLGKSFAYNPCKPFWHDGLIISKGDKWKSRRKFLTHIVTFKNLQSYMDIYNKESISLVKKLDDHFSNCPKNKAKTIDELLMTSSLNIIMEAAMGTDITKMTAAGDKSFVESVNTCMEIVVTRVLNPWLMIDWIWKLHPMSKYGFEVVSSARQYVRQTMEQNKKGKVDGEQTSLIEDLQEAGLTEEEITGEVFTIISAGYETTATTIHFLLFLLSLHPNHQELCRDEIDTVFEDPELCPGGNLTNAAFGKLKHLERCIQETLRFYPVVPVFQRHIEAPLELEKGIVIPANSVVTLFPQGIHMNPSYFPEPEKFNPDRFSIEEVKARPPFAYIPFSAGPRKCLGYKFAMLEAMSLSARILRNFVVTTNDTWDSLVLLPNITLKPETPINFMFEKRPHINNNPY